MQVVDKKAISGFDIGKVTKISVMACKLSEPGSHCYSVVEEKIIYLLWTSRVRVTTSRRKRAIIWKVRLMRMTQIAIT